MDQRRLPAHDRPVADIKFFPDGERLVTASDDGECVVWEAALGQRLQVLRHEARLFQVQVFPDGDRLATLGSDQRVVIWSVSFGDALQTMDLRGTCDAHRALRVLAGGAKIATGVSYMPDDPGVIWSVSDGKPSVLLEHAGGTLRFLESSPCGWKLATADYERISLWDVAGERLQHRLQRPFSWTPGVALSIGGAKVLHSSGRNILIWDGLTGKLAGSIALDAEVISFVLLGDGRRLVALTRSNASVWDVDLGERLRGLDGATGGNMQRLATSATGDLVAACGAPPSLRRSQQVAVWDTSSGRRLRSTQESSLQPWLGADLLPCSIAVAPMGAIEPWLLH